MLEARFSPAAAKYLKKIKDKRLKGLFKAAIDAIRDDCLISEEKTGDLSGIYCCDIFYNKTNYEIAYIVENEIIVFIMVGTRENFYNELKRYLK